MPAVTIKGGETVWYKKTGSGAPVLHIHGSAFGHRNFEKMTPPMSKHWEVLDFDLPGYGESTGKPRPGAMEGFAAQIVDFLEALGIAKIHVHGTSFGAMIGLTLAAKYPQVIDKLVLSCFVCRYDQAAREMRNTWKRAARDSGMGAVADLTSVAGFARAYYERPEAQAQLQSMREAFSKNTPAALIAGIEAAERTDLTPLVPLVKAPTLLIGGDEDNMTPYKPADSGVGFAQIKQMRPEWRMEILPQCGHYLVIEQPEKTTDLITAFLRS